MKPPVARQTPISELEARLASASVSPVDPVERIDALTQLAWELHNSDVPRSNALATEARELALKHEYKLGQARAVRTMAMTFRDIESLRSVFHLAEEAKRLFDEVNDGPGRAASRDFLASLHEHIGDLAGGLELALDALSIARELGDPIRQGYALSSVGGILAASGEVDAAVERLKEALQLFESAQDPRGVSTICSRLSKVFKNAGRSEEALTYAEMLRDAADPQDERSHAAALTVMADLESERGHSAEAERLYRAALDRVTRGVARSVVGAETQIALGRLLIKQGALTDAEFELNDALGRVEDESVQIVAEAAAHEALAELCECQGKLSKSIEHLRKAQALRERISQRDARNKLAQVEVRAAMEAAKKDAEIHKLRFVELHGQRSRRRVSMVEGPQLGNYQLLERLASGGMGEVWRARHRMLKREAAIKVIRRDVLASGSDEGDVLLRRFEREARATSALKSPHTVEIHDFGITEDGTFYYVMELLDGLSLHALVERYGPQPARRVAYILSQVCESLAEAHRNQLIHRDIKPSNILLCRYGLKRDFVKVLDFGLVKSTMRLGEGAADLTAAAVVGTPAFMPPEVAQPDVSFDPRSDIYALGCVGYWLLSAKLVFKAATPLQMVLAHVQTPAEPPSARTEMPIPADLERVVMTCLSKDPDDRPQSAEALSLQLDECSMGDRWSEARAAEWWNVHSPSTLVSSSELAQPVSEERLFLPMSAVRRVKGALRKWFVMAPALLILAGFGAWGLWLTIQALLASR